MFVYHHRAVQPPTTIPTLAKLPFEQQTTRTDHHYTSEKLPAKADHSSAGCQQKQTTQVQPWSISGCFVKFSVKLSEATLKYKWKACDVAVNLLLNCCEVEWSNSEVKVKCIWCCNVAVKFLWRAWVSSLIFNLTCTSPLLYLSS